MARVVKLQDEAFEKQLSALVKRYAANRANYVKKDSDYNETEIRTDYIDELFKALKWDVNNLKGLPPMAQEVRRERGPTRGEPDYTFRISSGETSATPVFFVEAKAPKESLDNKNHIFQAKSYAFSAAQSSLVLVVLTNFERFRLYSVDSEPSKDDGPDQGLVFDWPYDELEAKVDELLLFHRDNVAKGSLNKLARHGVPITMRPPVEKPFLNRLDTFREKVAKGFFNSNKGLSERDLNLLTDLILNRIVFIRFAEDRKILPPEDLRQVVKQWEYRKSEPLLSALNTYFDELNRRFNGRMFSDETSLSSFEIDDYVLTEIVEGFYPPNCPYRFDQIRVELLGEIYEKYLGKVITRKGRGVVVEEKPDVRHAKGVYYTPAYIVDEILKSCLLPKLQTTKTIEEIFELKGVDPACGSGTFLLGAYRLIEKFIFNKALENQKSKERYLDEIDGFLKIKYAVKRNILEYCLHGVDIDARAIRVSELSLYLKLLEDEPDVAKNPIPYLPSLYKNLQFGNSLIDGSMIPQDEFDMEDSVLNRVSPFTWETNESFGQIMANGGFDWVMGNPPYIRMQVLRKFSGRETDLIQASYSEMKKGNPDIYIAFIVRSLAKLKRGGSMGFILSNKFMSTDYGRPIRQELAKSYDVRNIVDFGHEQVFQDAVTHTCILVVDKAEPKGLTQVMVVKRKPEPEIFANGASGVFSSVIDLRKFQEKYWDFDSVREPELMRAGFSRLGDLCEIFQGLRTSDNAVFVLSKAEEEDGFVTGYSRALKKKVSVEAELCRKFVRGREVGRNYHAKIGQRIIFPYHESDAYKLIPLSELRSKFPKTAEYLKSCEKRLKKREDGDFDQRHWYGYIYLKNHDLMAMPKVMIQEMAPRAHLTLDKSGEIFFVTAYGLHIKKKADRTLNHYRFIQALLKTNRLDSQIVAVASKLKAGYQYRKQYVENLPIPVFDSDDSNHGAIVTLQEQIERIGEKLRDGREAATKREYQAQIDSLERDIETLANVVYEGTRASSGDIKKVHEIIGRIEQHVEAARKKASKKTKTKLKKA